MGWELQREDAGDVGSGPSPVFSSFQKIVEPFWGFSLSGIDIFYAFVRNLEVGAVLR